MSENNDDVMTKEEHAALITKMFDGLSKEEAKALDDVYRTTYKDWLKSGRQAVQKASVRRKQEALQADYKREMDKLLKRGASKYERLKLRDTWREKGLNI